MSECLNHVVLCFFSAKKIKPTENSVLILYEYGSVYIGSYFDGRFYKEGNIRFPTLWAYAPLKSLSMVEDSFDEK